MHGWMYSVNNSLLYSDGLVLLTLLINHDISFIKYKHDNLAGIYNLGGMHGDPSHK